MIARFSKQIYDVTGSYSLYVDILLLHQDISNKTVFFPHLIHIFVY